MTGAKVLLFIFIFFVYRIGTRILSDLDKDSDVFLPFVGTLLMKRIFKGMSMITTR